MKTFKKILLFIVTLPYLLFLLFINLIWFLLVLLGILIIIFFDWLKDNLEKWEEYLIWKIFFRPFLYYLDDVWDIDLL